MAGAFLWVVIEKRGGERKDEVSLREGEKILKM
jgi:hypothetical protein